MLSKKIDLQDINKSEFTVKKFNDNIFRGLIITPVLAIKQFLFYRYLAEDILVFNKNIFLIFSIIFLIFSMVNFYYYLNSKDSVNLIEQIYTLSIGILGIFIINLKFITLSDSIVYYSIIYVGAIFGIALYARYNYWQSFIIYATGILLAIYFNKIYYSAQNLFILNIDDIIMFNLGGFIISTINYNYSLKKYAYLNKLQKLSETDQLTGLCNRRKINDILSERFKISERYNRNFSIIMCDLDFFKDINDKWGHQIGDQVLIEVSDIFKQNTREVDIVSRWGGEEFLIILPESNNRASCKFAKRLQEALEKNTFALIDDGVTASFGVASYRDGDSIEKMIERADQRLYRAKERGRNLVVCE